MRDFYTIKPSDVGEARIKWHGHYRSVVDVLGFVQPGDIGKRIYDMGEGVLQVENNEQRDTRLGKGPVDA